MMLAHQFLESLHGLRMNPLRSSLSIIGVVFGVASVVAMLGIGIGAEREIDSIMSALGANTIHVTQSELTDAEWARVASSSLGLGERDVAMAQELFPEATVVPVAHWKLTDASEEIAGAKLDAFGVGVGFLKATGLKIVAGRALGELESKWGAPVCLLGQALAQSWFPGSAENAVGREIRLGRSWFRVVGVLATSPDAPKEGSQENGMNMLGGGGDPGLKALDLGTAVVVSLEAGTGRLGPRRALGGLERMIVQLSQGTNVLDARTALTLAETRLHRGSHAIKVTAADEVVAQKRNATRLFSYFLMTIALISLIVGGIGIANVMLASMVERVREVGLRRAIGAKRRHILSHFLIESLTVCLIGGLAGGVLGLGVAFLIGWLTGWSVALPWWGLAVAVLVSTLVGLAAGLYPARTASKLSPIEALQGRA